MTGLVQPSPSPGHASPPSTLQVMQPKVPAPKRQRESATPATTTPNAQRDARGINFQVLHQVICPSGFHSGKGQVFSAIPTWTVDKSQHAADSRSHLHGQSSVPNVADFIKKSGDISFLVFRYYRCSDAGRWDQGRKRDSECDLNFEENVAIVSASLQDVIDNISRCKSGTLAYYPHSRSDSRDGEADEYSAAFFYHHRQALAAAATFVSVETKRQISALLAYIETSQGETYSEMDSLTSQGLVPRQNISMLFCPNDIILSAAGNIYQAYVLRAWPRGTSTTDLDCWGWGFDGHLLHRRAVPLTVRRPLGFTVKIADLGVYPLKFAPIEAIQHLKARGERFWSLREQSFVAYEGWDLNKDQFYVSSCPLGSAD